MRVFFSGAAGVLCGFLVLAPAYAADPVQAPIQGQSVMGDKGRTGPDGWSWAPQTRDQVPGNPGQTAASLPNSPNTMPNPNAEAGKRLPAGQDPGTPAQVNASGPGTKDAPAPHQP